MDEVPACIVCPLPASIEFLSLWELLLLHVCLVEEADMPSTCVWVRGHVTDVNLPFRLHTSLRTKRAYEEHSLALHPL